MFIFVPPNMYRGLRKCNLAAMNVYGLAWWSWGLNPPLRDSIQAISDNPGLWASQWWGPNICQETPTKHIYILNDICHFECQRKHYICTFHPVWGWNCSHKEMCTKCKSCIAGHNATNCFKPEKRANVLLLLWPALAAILDLFSLAWQRSRISSHTHVFQAGAASSE